MRRPTRATTRRRAGKGADEKPPRDLRPAAKGCAIVGVACLAAFLTGGASLLTGVVGGAAVATGGGLAVKHIRDQRRQGRRGLPFLPMPGDGLRHIKTYGGGNKRPKRTPKTRAPRTPKAAPAQPIPVPSGAPAKAKTVPCGCAAGSNCAGVGKCRCAKCKTRPAAKPSAGKRAPAGQQAGS